MIKPRKVLIIGSGPIVIGQAAEFDYAGTQACKALREEGVTSVLVNSNPATIMTDLDVADVVYIEPLTVPVVERIIARERPDALLPTLGGQTGLNLAMALAEAGVLEKYNVRLIGANLDTIRKAEDRAEFADLLRSIGEPVPPSETVTTMEEALAAKERIGLPLVIRPAFTLGGTGGGIANTKEEYARIVAGGLAASPITQVLVEKSLVGWKELEYEVMRDANDTCITICNMENIDPMGVHTGDSIVVAPSQTLSDRDHQMLRSAALKIIRALKIEGGCNVQFALAPRKDVVPWWNDPLPPAPSPTRGEGEHGLANAAQTSTEGSWPLDVAAKTETTLTPDPSPTRGEGSHGLGEAAQTRKETSPALDAGQADLDMNSISQASAPPLPLWERGSGGEDGLLPYYVIEVNPRVSRSSALASKATGYPIARVAAKIALGKHLEEIPNAVTRKTTAAFEPALDYVVVKIPRWPFDKFQFGDRALGTQMKATGEVMAVDRTFEAALQKAVRSLEFGGRSLLWRDSNWDDPTARPLHATDERLWSLFAALRAGMEPDELARKTGVDPWFITKFCNIINMEKRLLGEELTPALLRSAKRMGFSDRNIASLADTLPDRVRESRQRWGIRPVYKMVDTCAAEFDAATPYFYSTYEQENEALPLPEPKAVVISSGPIRIGQGIEFDYCAVQAAWALQAAGYQAIIINSNPETVSTDFDTSDRLYFEALDEEAVRDILENEAGEGEPPPSIVQFGGQTAINLAGPLSLHDLPIIGSSAEAIDLAEDRRRFEDFLSRLGIPQPPGAGVTTVEEALRTAQLIGYPVLVRPSYVLGGRAMEIVQNASELVRYMAAATDVSTGRPILIDKYLEGKEVEVDALCDGERVLIPGIMEHIERAGVHSGDSMAVYPGINLTEAEVETVVDYTQRIGMAIGARGLMNVQYVIVPRAAGDGSDVYVLEVNPRGSRTVPFLSKVTTVPMVQVAVNIMLGKTLAEQGYEGGLWRRQKLIAVKAPVFSMSKLIGVDTYLGPEMKSTGEVMGIDFTWPAALAKALIASDLLLPASGAALLSISDGTKVEAMPIVRTLAAAGYCFYATEGTAEFIRALGFPVEAVAKITDGGHPNVVDVIRDGSVDVVINTSENRVTGTLRDGFHIRRAATERRIPCFTSIDTARAAAEALAEGGSRYEVRPMPEYLAGPVTGPAS